MALVFDLDLEDTPAPSRAATRDSASVNLMLMHVLFAGSQFTSVLRVLLKLTGQSEDEENVCAPVPLVRLEE